MHGRMRIDGVWRFGVMALGLLALVIAAPAAAPQEAQSPRATFSSSSDLVVLHVTVVDRKAGFVAGLPREVFTVYEDEKPQPITFFRNEDSPVSVGLVIDSSSSMQRKRDEVIAAGLAFAKSSHPEDQFFTIN